jgi:DNA polymerase-3 subunit epsilon
MSKAWHQHPVLSVDLETTGVDPLTAKIVSYATLLVNPDGSINTFASQTSIVDPGIEIPEGAAAVHGITTERAKAEGIPHEDAVSHLVGELLYAETERTPVVVYNASYDLTIIKVQAEALGLHLPRVHVIDPLVLDRHLDKYRKGKRTLEAACKHYEVSLDDAHDSGADALAAARLAYALAKRYRPICCPLEQLHSWQVTAREDWRAGFEEYLRRKDPEATVERGWPVLEQLRQPPVERTT